MGEMVVWMVECMAIPLSLMRWMERCGAPLLASAFQLAFRGQDIFAA